MVFLGRISFSLYMIYQIVLRAYQANAGYFSEVPNNLLFIGYVAASNLAAICLCKVIEEPAQRAIKCLYNGRATPLNSENPPVPQACLGGGESGLGPLAEELALFSASAANRCIWKGSAFGMVAT